MELQEHLDDNPELREWYEAMKGEMDRLADAGFPHIVPGVRDESAGITHDNYLNVFEALASRRIWHTGDGKDIDVGYIPTFDEWKRAERENVTEHIEFSHCECDLCRTTLGGGRHYVTALPPDPLTNDDFVSYTVCGDCYVYICNGDLPER